MLKRIRTGLPILALVAGTLLSTSPALAAETKWCVVHNLDTPHIIEVHESALADHLAHGNVLFLLHLHPEAQKYTKDFNTA